MASMEELAYRWTELKKIQITQMSNLISFGGIMGTLKNISAVPIKMRLQSFNDSEYHFDWHPMVAAEDHELTLLPGDSIGPLFLNDMYFRTTHGDGLLLVIRKELR
ncbi:MAG: hypothetical protein ACRCX2_29870 [Paraclostridium sp.]